MRQLKSTHQDLRVLFEDQICVRHVSEKLETCRVDKDAEAVRIRMEKRDFDVLGIEADGHVYGYVERTVLDRGRCEQYGKTFHPSELIAESTPLVDLLPILHDAPRVFVLDRNSIMGIVTRGDLQKVPVRIMLFGLVSLLEMHFLRLIRARYPNDAWKRLLSHSRLEAAGRLLVERQDRNEAIDLADCLQFCDKRYLILKNPELWRGVGLKGKKSGERFFKLVEALRDKLAHAQDIVTGSSWTDLIDLTRELEMCLKRCEEMEFAEEAANG